MISPVLLVILCAVLVALGGYATLVAGIAARAMLWDLDAGGRTGPSVRIGAPIVTVLPVVLALLMVLWAALVVLR